MELNHDWISFQEMFYPRKRVRNQKEGLGPIYLVVDQGTVITAYTETDDLSAWAGLPFNVVKERPECVAKKREIVVFDCNKVDEAIQTSLKFPHFYEQIEHLRETTKADLELSTSSSAGKSIDVKKHFLLTAMESWWSKVLPSNYGIYISIETQPQKHILLMVRRGKFDCFHEPDLTPLGPERRRQPADVVRYLSEKHLAPVQGVFVSGADWAEWSQLDSPWRKIAQSVKANRTHLVPFRWSVTTLMATRAFFGL